MMGNSFLSGDPELEFIVGACDAQNRSHDSSQVTDWSRVVALAIEHRVYPRVYQYARPAFPEHLHADLRSRAEANAREALHNIERTRDVLALLHKQGIEAIVLKGPLLAHFLYGDFGLRHAGDVDILVRGADLLRAGQTLHCAGYHHHTVLTRRSLARHRRREHDVAFAHPADNTLVELHAEIAQPHYGYRFDLDEWWSDRSIVRVGGSEFPVLSHEHGYLLAAVHAAKHRWERLDLICDLAVYRRKDLDWGKVYADAAEAWLLTALRVGEEVSAGFFGDSAPISAEARAVSKKVVAGERFGRRDGVALDLALRERGRDQVRYLWRRLLSAKLKL